MVYKPLIAAAAVALTSSVINGAAIHGERNELANTFDIDNDSFADMKVNDDDEGEEENIRHGVKGMRLFQEHDDEDDEVDHDHGDDSHRSFQEDIDTYEKILLERERLKNDEDEDSEGERIKNYKQDVYSEQERIKTNAVENLEEELAVSEVNDGNRNRNRNRGGRDGVRRDRNRSGRSRRNRKERSRDDDGDDEDDFSSSEEDECTDDEDDEEYERRPRRGRGRSGRNRKYNSYEYDIVKRSLRDHIGSRISALKKEING